MGNNFPLFINLMPVPVSPLHPLHPLDLESEDVEWKDFADKMGLKMMVFCNGFHKNGLDYDQLSLDLLGLKHLLLWMAITIQPIWNFPEESFTCNGCSRVKTSSAP